MIRQYLRAIVLAMAFGPVLSAQGQEPQPPTPVPNQFGPPTAVLPSGYIVDNVYGEQVNFETMMVKPILVTSDGQFVVVGNEADNRLVVMNQSLAWPPIAEIVLGQGICSVVERPNSNEIWVTLRHQCAVVVVEKANWTITHMLRPTITGTDVGVGKADTMSGLAFDSAGQKAYVAASSAEYLLRFDAATKTPLTPVALKASHNGRSTFMNEPFAVAVIENVGGNADKDFVLVASYRSGNQTLAEVNTSTSHPLITSQVTNLTGNATRSLPDFDILAYDIAADSIAFVVKNCGTVLNGILPISSTDFFVSNTESRNGERIGESSFPGGSVIRNRLTKVTLAANGSGAQTVQSEVIENLTNLPAPPWINVVQPTDMVFDAGQNRIFVAGYGSQSIGVFNPSMRYIASIPTDAGPLGVALSPNGQKLFAYNRAAATVTSYDLSAGIPTTIGFSRALPDPTFDRVKSGRILFLDSTHSMRQTTSCASCHAHLRNDGLTWDLSRHYDPGVNFSITNFPTNWKDPKGPMQTQDLRSLEEIPGYHWRGEQADIEDFAGVFQELLKGTPHTARDFQRIKDYIFSGRYPANPFQMVNRDLTPTAVEGATAFIDPSVLGIPGPGCAQSCARCHSLPLGSDGSTTDQQQHGSGDLTIKTTQLRGLWDKESDIADLTGAGTDLRAMIGTGFMHHGEVMSISKFIDDSFTGFARKDELKVFLREFDSGVAPAANFSEWTSAVTPTPGAFLVAEAEAGHCDLAVRGWIQTSSVWRQVGFFYRTDLDGFVCSDGTIAGPSNPWTLSQFHATFAAGQARWLFLGCPKGSGRRLGIDRDRDLVHDDDEIALGTDPSRFDTDGDGFWDGYDGDPTNPAISSVPNVPPTISNVVVQWVTTASAKITYETSTLSPSWVRWHKSDPSAPQPLTNVAGDDDVPFPTGAANATNRWKTKHQVMIRKLEADRSYEFEVVAQGQNGMTATTSRIAFTTENVHFTNQYIVTDIQLSQTTSGGFTDWTAVVNVQHIDGTTVRGLRVWPVLTVSTGGVLSQVQYVDPTPNGIPDNATNPQGVATLTWQVPAQSSGDWTIIDIPVAEWLSGNQKSGVKVPVDLTLPLAFRSRFTWPKSTVRSVRVDVP